MLKAAIDLLWVRHNKVGGIESYIRNLLDGFKLSNMSFEFTLLTSIDNEVTFKEYVDDTRFKIYICNIKSSNVGKRIIWQNLFMGSVIRKLGLKICFEPYYCKPILGVSDIKFITTIHDLQALHYPEYFSLFKRLWMRIAWYNTINTSSKIIAISNFVKNDILTNYKIDKDRISMIYNPVTIDINDVYNFDYIKKKYNIKEKEYYFTLSSLLPHKNIKTLINVLNQINSNNISLPKKLIVSGIGGNDKEKMNNLIHEYNLENSIILTNFIDNTERNTLYKYCRAFLFPSVFEGFGMPPVEAMMFGKAVITTNKTCIQEVTLSKAMYVSDPYNIDEWITYMLKNNVSSVEYNLEQYDKGKIAEKYISIMKECLFLVK